MIKIENIEVSGWEAAIRGMRNPMNSWDKSDSYWTYIEDPETMQTARFEFFVGDNDLALMRNLRKGGADHGKFMRMIDVYTDITAMQPWWFEFDTYKIATVRNSCSKMHKIHVKPFEWADFETQGISRIDYASNAFMNVLNACERLRLDFNGTQDKKYWRALIELLPEGYKMRATVKLNYEVLRNMYHARKAHKLTEWHDFCAVVSAVPYANDLICGGKAHEHDPS